MFEIRDMKADDIEGVLQVERESFSIPWSRKLFFDELENPHTVYFVCCDGIEIIGYGGMWHVVDEGQITNIAVRKKFRGMKVGSRLLSELIGWACKKEISVIGLEVRAENKAAMALYEKFGFVPVGRRKDYYREPTEDAVLMDLRLKDE